MNEPTIPSRPLQSLNDRVRGSLRRGPLRILAIVLLIVLIGVIVFAVVYAARQPRPTFAVAHRGDVIISTQAQGSIQATMYQADFAVNGTLSQIDVTVGEQIHQGDTLAKLDVAPFQSALTAAQNAESGAQQSLSAAQEAQGTAQSAVASASNAVSAQESYAQVQCSTAPNDPDACAAAQAAVSRAQADLAAAQAQLATARAQEITARHTATAAQSQTQQAQAQLASATLIAPHDGVITVINGAVGGKPGATPQGNAAFITIADTSAPLATTVVSYREIDQVHVGQAATFRVAQASASAIFTGVVTGVSPQGQGTGATLSYPVALRLDPASLGGAKLLPGMSADIRIITRARYDVIVIANSAVSYARTAAPLDGSGLLTSAQIASALKTARAEEQQAIASGFNTTNDPLTPAYLIGFQNQRYIAIPVVLGLTDGRQWEVVAGLQVGQRVVDGQHGIFG